MNDTTTERLLALMSRLIPLVDSLADKLRVVLLALAGLLLWFGIYLGVIKEWSWQTTATTLLLVVIPLAIVGRLYWSLRDLQSLPEIMDEAGDDLRASWTDVRNGKRGAMNIVGQAKRLFELKGLLGSADELIGHYVSFGVLINPLFLVLAVLALVFTLLLLPVALVTLLSVIF